MENKTHSNHHVSQRIKDFLALEPGAKKNFLYKKEFRGAQSYVDNYLIKDGIIYASSCVFKVTRGANNQYYLKQTNKTGFTVTPDGKMSVWFGRDLREMHQLINGAVNFLEIDWFQSYKLDLSEILTASLYGKIFTGRITNLNDLCKKMISLKRWKGLSPKYLKDFINAYIGRNLNCIGYSDRTVTPFHISSIVKTAKDPNHALERFINDVETLMDVDIMDMIDQADTLGQKINYRWSEKRLRQIHKDWTKELMVFELDNISDEMYFYAENLLNLDVVKENLSVIRPLLNSKDLFIHAKFQHHCVYTNYSTRIALGKYLAFEIQRDNKIYTLGVHMDVLNNKDTKPSKVKSDLFVFDQVRAKYNESAPKDVQELCLDYLKKFNNQVDPSYFKESLIDGDDQKLTAYEEHDQLAF